MGLWDVASILYRVNKVSKSLIGIEENKNLTMKIGADYQRMATGFQEQADLVYAIAELNIGTIFRAGRIATQNVLEDTYKMVSAQKAMIRHRGFLVSGSGQQMIDETVANGMGAAREAAFNARMEALNSSVNQTIQTVALQNASKSASQQGVATVTQGKKEAKNPHPTD